MIAGPRIAALSLLALAVAACGDKGATQFEGETSADPIVVYGQCAFCHEVEATQLATHGGHASLAIKCELCHEEVSSVPGPGHRAVPQCADCHSGQKTHHDPATGTAAQCLVCHTPHGSPNLLLVNPFIRTPDGSGVPIELTRLSGRADGGFASATDPGTGLCEVCHTTTRFYRSDGTGESHFAFACYTCHPHGAGFAPTM